MSTWAIALLSASAGACLGFMMLSPYSPPAATTYGPELLGHSVRGVPFSSPCDQPPQCDVRSDQPRDRQRQHRRVGRHHHRPSRMMPMGGASSSSFLVFSSTTFGRPTGRSTLAVTHDRHRPQRPSIVSPTSASSPMDLIGSLLPQEPHANERVGVHFIQQDANGP